MNFPFKFQIQKFKEVDSTNTFARLAADNGAPDGSVFVADHQTTGRGQQGRKWSSPPGENLLFSLLLRPLMTPQKATMITQIACQSVGSVLKEKYGIESTTKWPNDILVDGKKICGILVESSSSAAELQDVIIGIGLNVNAVPEKSEVPSAVCMKDLGGKALNRDKILKDLLDQLEKDIAPIYGSPS